VPPLRERTEDIPLLCEHFLEKYRQRHQRNVKSIAPAAYHVLIRHRWPGNVRELENVMERALVLDETGVIGPEDLPDKIRFGMQQRGTLVIDSPNMTIEELEREYILKVLHHTRWQKKRASEILGINASTLYRKLISYGFEKGVAEGEGGEAAA
jgi:DNA-binding NtrC family response regulator